jgi:hypothetical protein
MTFWVAHKPKKGHTMIKNNTALISIVATLLNLYHKEALQKRNGGYPIYLIMINNRKHKKI